MESRALLKRTTISFCILLCLWHVAVAQADTIRKFKPNVTHVSTNSAVFKIRTDTTPVQRAILGKRIRINPDLSKMVYRLPVLPVPPGENLDKYLAGRQDCATEKSIDSNNCVLVRYPDGLIKKICDGKLTEVVTPDGKRHVPPAMMQTMMMVPKIPIPRLNNTDTTYLWIAQFNSELRKDIQSLLGNNADLLNQYMKRETQQCEGDIFKQLVYRITFMENFLVAN